MPGRYDTGGSYQPLSPNFAYFQVLSSAPPVGSTGRSYFDTSLGIGVFSSGIWNYASGGGGAVSSVFGRTGDITAQSNDYTFAQIASTPTTLSAYGITDPVVLTSGSYSNPSWITGLAWSKISATPTTVLGYGITDAATLTGAQTLTNKVISGSSNTLSNIAESSVTNLTSDLAAKQASLSGTGFVKISGTTISYDATTYQQAITLTTAGTSGASTLVSGTLNIPQYTNTTPPGGSTTQFQYNNAGAFGGAAGLVWDSTNSGVKFNSNSLGITNTNAKGLYIQNSTAAAVGAQQYSPTVVWEGQGWKTNATAGSQAVAFREYLGIIQGAANPAGIFQWDGSINGGAYVNLMNLSTAGQLIVASTIAAGGSISATGNVTATAAIGAGAASLFTWGAGTTQPNLYSDSNYTLNIRNGTNAQAIKIYNTYTSGSVFESANIGFIDNSNVFTIQTTQTGATQRPILITGGLAFAGDVTVTAGSSSTVANTTFNTYFNPASLIATYALTLPASPINGQEEYVYFGGTITSGTVVTSMTISANSGQAILGATATAAVVVAGAVYRFHYNLADTTWYGAKLN